MARVTVEDCVEVVENRFELVALAAERAKNIAAGAPITVDRDNDKNAVIALREIASATVSVEKLKETLVQDQQRYANKEVDPEVEAEENGGASEDDQAPSSCVSEASAKEAIDEISTLSGKGDISETDGFSFGDDNLEVDD